MGQVLLTGLVMAGVVLLVRESVRRQRGGEPWSRVLAIAAWVPFVGALGSLFLLPPADEPPDLGGRTTPSMLDGLVPTTWQTALLEGLLLLAGALMVAVYLTRRWEARTDARRARLAGEAVEPWYWPAGVVAVVTFVACGFLLQAAVMLMSLIEDRLYGPVLESVPESELSPAVAAQMQENTMALMAVMFAFVFLPFVATPIAYVVQRVRIARMERAYEEQQIGIDRRLAESATEAATGARREIAATGVVARGVTQTD